MNSRIEIWLGRLVGIAIGCFVVAYIYAALCYPGGHQLDLQSQGFSWVHNYWCDLTNAIAQNGSKNLGSGVAVAGLLLLSIGLAAFIVRFAMMQYQNTKWQYVIGLSGMVTMVCVVLIATPLHNQMIAAASCSGAVVLIGVMRVIYRSGSRGMKLIGLGCCFLLALNNAIYFTENGIEYLPLLQKVTMGVVLLWILWVNKSLPLRSPS